MRLPRATKAQRLDRNDSESGGAGAAAGNGDLERRRKLGQFFTPPEIANFMWDMVLALRGRSFPKRARVMEPACGEGVFLRAALERGPAWELFGVDLDETLLPLWRDDASLKTARLARANGLLDNPSIGLEAGAFDVVIGNPPFSGAGFRELLRLLGPPSKKRKSRQRGLFDEAPTSAEPSSLPLRAHERIILDSLARELSRYACWRVRDESDGEEEEAGAKTSERGLFDDLPRSSGRRLQPDDYDRVAETFRNWPAGTLLDVRRPDLRAAIQRLAATAIEVYFVERFVQLAKPKGIIAMIVPESILAADRLLPLRAWFVEHAQLLAVVSLPQKVFTGVGAKARTGIMFGRRFTAAEEERARRLPRTGAGMRVLPELLPRKVAMASLPKDGTYTLAEYLNNTLAGVQDCCSSGILKGW